MVGAWDQQRPGRPAVYEVGSGCEGFGQVTGPLWITEATTKDELQLMPFQPQSQRHERQWVFFPVAGTTAWGPGAVPTESTIGLEAGWGCGLCSIRCWHLQLPGQQSE